MKMFLFLMLYSFLTYSFNWDKCYNTHIKGDPRGAILGTSTSSTSFISSSGDCAAIGYHSTENKQKYYVENGLDLQLDIAKGEGPYLFELSSLYGCKDQQQVASELNKNYSQIYKNQNTQLGIEELLLNQNCAYL